MKTGVCNKRGMFRVDDRFFQGLSVGEGVNLFIGMVVLETRRDYMQGFTEYYAIHVDFRPINQGEITPEYHAEFSQSSSAPKWKEVAQ